MEWTALISTALGAVIGVGSTLLADRLRWKRDTGERERETLHATYAQFLEALTLARDLISHASRDPTAAEENRRSVTTALLDHGVHVKQYQLELLAPPQVVAKARDAADKLAAYRDVVAEGGRRDDPACTKARRAFRSSRQELMEAMRAAVAHRTGPGR
ncbi:hypothetical protein ACFT5C_01525 [Streptomyces sp. NPDC057116]|uniref:hypothetical protein n=1 Tax=Streptomyces sp. NPDC057116 TaxID=3346023 RepID=UPI003641B321